MSVYVEFFVRRHCTGCCHSQKMMRWVPRLDFVKFFAILAKNLLLAKFSEFCWNLLWNRYLGNVCPFNRIINSFIDMRNSEEYFVVS